MYACIFFYYFVLLSFVLVMSEYVISILHLVLFVCVCVCVRLCECVCACVHVLCLCVSSVGHHSSCGFVVLSQLADHTVVDSENQVLLVRTRSF